MSAAANTFQALCDEVDAETNALWASGSGVPDVATARRLAYKTVAQAIRDAEEIWAQESVMLCRKVLHDATL